MSVALPVNEAANYNQASSGFSLGDLPNRLLQLEANDTSSITEVLGAVSQWDDKSGNGSHATQGTGSLQPTTNLVTINGQNAIDFDGTEELDLPNDSLATGDQNRSCFMHALSDQTSGLNRLISQGINNIGQRWTMSLTDNNPQQLRVEIQGSGHTATTLTATQNQVHLFGNTLDGTNLNDMVLFLDGSSEASSTSASVGTNGNGNFIGSWVMGTNQFEGQICDIVYSDVVYSASQIADIRAYGMNLWGTT